MDVKTKALQLKNRFIFTIKKAVNVLKKDVYISIGENCLSDIILLRFGLKSFSSPFSSGRSNVEYILDFEKEKYADFINKDYLVYEFCDNKKVARNKKYLDVQNNYNPYCLNGFEFTHHDVIGDDTARAQLQRRVKRMLGLKGKNIVMLYHHRKCDDTDMDLLIKHLQELSSIYEARKNKVSIYLYYQIIVSDQDSRHVEYSKEENINIFKFYTLTEWTGEDPELMGARCDNDLLKTMFDKIKAGS